MLAQRGSVPSPRIVWNAMSRVLYPDGTIGVAPKEHVFLTGTPKSGGVHISNGLGMILGWRRSSIASWQQEGMIEHDINPHVAWTILPQGAFIFHQHTRAWPANTQMLANFELRPIVLSRNVADIIQAVRDNVLKPYQKDFDPKGMPGVYIPGSFDNMTCEEQELFLVDNLAPWLLSFYVSWRRQTVVPCLFITYEEHFKDQVKSFRKMLDWIGWGQGVPDEAIKRAANTKPHNFNVGVSGRGRQLHDVALVRLQEQMRGWGEPWGPMLERDLLSWT